MRLRSSGWALAVGLMALLAPRTWAQVDVSAWPEVQMELFVSGPAPAEFLPGMVSLSDSGGLRHVASLKPVRAPQSLCILIDNSNSMKTRLPELKAAAARFIAKLPAEDEVCVATIGPALGIRSKLTLDHAAAAGSLEDVEAHGGSGLIDGIMNAAEYMRDAARNRSRSFVLFSDAFDNRSLSDPRTFAQQMETSGSPVLYLVDFGGGEAGVEVGGGRYGLPREVIADAVVRGGGTACAPRNEQEMTASLEALNEQLHRRYLLAYTVGKAERDGQERRVQVTLNEAYAGHGLKIRAPGGYYAPSQ